MIYFAYLEKQGYNIFCKNNTFVMPYFSTRWISESEIENFISNYCYFDLNEEEFEFFMEKYINQSLRKKIYKAKDINEFLSFMKLTEII
jgi:hypothetical protein